jgi:hypothetical protein
MQPPFTCHGTAAFRWVAYAALLTFALGLVSVALWIGFVNSPIFD